MTGLVALVALNGATKAFDKLYTYAVPPELHAKARAGSRVLVPFGNGNTKRQGIIFEIKNDELKSLKKLLAVTDNKPVLSEEMLELCEYMHKTVFCTYYDAVKAMLPTGLGLKLINFYSANGQFCGEDLLNETEKEIFDYLSQKGEKEEDALKTLFGVESDVLDSLCEKGALVKDTDLKRKVGDATQKWVRLTSDDISDIKFTPRQTEVVNLLSDIGAAAVKEICYFTGVSTAVIEGLIKKGVLQSFSKQVYRTPYKSADKKCEEIKLTEEQQAAFSGLLNEYKADKAAVSLLYGVTGSGKTQVFLKLADEVIAGGKGVIVMVPEIALTPQLISIFTERYGSKIAVFHSAMSLGQRMDEWQRVKNGKALIAIGTRSAIFAPFENLGLVIIDEEQEHTYKSEKSPRFHTRDVAKFRTAYHKGLLVLASATPSVESFTKAKSGKYSLYKLTHRYGERGLPEVRAVDMRKEILSGNSGVLSAELYEAVKTALENKKQAILLLNRRGHNTYISCAECGAVASCPNCSISLTYHSANDRLMCHYCGYSVKAERVCSECGSEHVKFMGIGTQRAEEELKALFPSARILRLDADSTVSRDSYQTYLTAFKNGEYDILLGTQMVAKGLDFPEVTVVGVLGADAASFSEDFRSFERTFSLLTQVVGRAGRGENSGLAIIQTTNPDSELIALAQNQDYDSFYENEILTRRLMVYPPYCDICVVGSSAIRREDAEKAINDVFKNIKALTGDEFKAVKIIILGPSPAAVAKVNNKYRYRMIIKCKNNSEFRTMLDKALDIKLPLGATVSVDMNPETII